MSKLFSVLTVTLLSVQGLLSLTATSHANTPNPSQQPLLIAFDGFDDDGGGGDDDMTSDDGNTDDAMDDGSSSASGPAPGEEQPDSGFRTGYNPSNE